LRRISGRCYRYRGNKLTLSAANSLLADMASKYRVQDANATGIGRSISWKKEWIFGSDASRKHKVIVYYSS